MDDNKNREKLLKELEKIKKEAEKFANGVERIIEKITKSGKEKDEKEKSQ